MRSTEFPVSEVDLGAGIFAFFTSRQGGHSQGPYDSLNLGTQVGDNDSLVAANRALIETHTGMPVVYLNQVHGNVVHAISSAHVGAQEGAAAGDGATCLEEGVGLAVYVADCVPVLLADPVLGQIAIAHAGRPGLVSDVIGATVQAMVDNGSNPTDINAAVGPCICPNCYEVPEEMSAEFTRVTGAPNSKTIWRTPSVDLRAAASLALVRSGVKTVTHVAVCTYESAESEPGFFSHRWATHNTEATAGLSGRFAGIIGRKKPEVPGEICR